MKLLSVISNLINEGTEYVRKFRRPNKVLTLYTQEHQEESSLGDLDFNNPETEKEIQNIIDKKIRRRIPSKLIAQSVNNNFDKIWENGWGLLQGCEYKQCRILFIDTHPQLGQIEYILQFYKNSRLPYDSINAIIVTSAISRKGNDFLRSMKTPTPKVRLSEQFCKTMRVVYL